MSFPGIYKLLLPYYVHHLGSILDFVSVHTNTFLKNESIKHFA